MTIHSKTFEEHLLHVANVIRIIKENNLKLKSSKCRWFCKSAKVLGHVISNGEVKMDPTKVECVKNRQAPKNIRDLQSFLGLCNYYRRFVKDFAKIAIPLTILLKSDTPFIWTDEQQKSFEELKSRLVSYPILRQPDLKRKFLVYTDASGFAIGGILAQLDDFGQEYVTMYVSRNLKGAERQYGITEKECLAVLWAIRQFHCYLFGVQFTVITDHSALVWLKQIRNTSDRLARWAIYLQTYNFDIIHRKGINHSNVDALSRPVEVNNVTIVRDNDDDNYNSLKTLDPFENEPLLEFLKNKKYMPGLSVKQMKLIDKLNKLYFFKLNNFGKLDLFYKKDEKELLVPQIEFRDEIILKAHLLGHFQVSSTLKGLQDRFYWPKMQNDIVRVISSCEPCKRHKIEPIIEHSAKVLNISSIFERISLDFVFGLPLTSEGYCGILVIQEYLTKYPMAYPMKSKTAVETATALFNYISFFGPPKIILTDMGTEFNNSIVNFLIKNLGVEHRVTSAYHPRTNGLVEKFNHTLLSSLKRHCEENEEDWPKWLPYILMAYRSRVHSSTRYTPFELIFGRKMLNFEDYSSCSKDKIDSETAILKRTVEIRQLVDSTHPKALENIEKSQEKQTRYQNLRGNIKKTLEIGTSVYVETKGLHNKLYDKYKGPFTIYEIAKGGNYLLKNILNEKLGESFPLERLKVVRDVNKENYQKIEKILNDRLNNQGNYEYLIKWQNSDLSGASWEPAENFVDLNIINNYWKNKTKNSNVFRIIEHEKDIFKEKSSIPILHLINADLSLNSDFDKNFETNFGSFEF